MQGAMTRAARTYRQTHVQTESPLGLVVMLYDGAIRFMTEARDAIKSGDRLAKRTAISHSLAIVSELQSTLNMKEGGAIAESLDNIYTFVNTRLLDASMHNEPGAIDEALRVLAPLKDAWSQIADAPPAPPQAHP